MGKRSSKSPSGARVVVLLAALALALFVAGEGIVMARTDSGRLMAARYLRIGDRADITRLIGRQIRRGLDAAGVRRDSVTESVREGTPSVRWRVGLKPGASGIQANYAITRALEEDGGAVLSGREHPGKDGALETTLIVGIPGRPTHEVVLVETPEHAVSEKPAARTGEVALLLYGFGDDAKTAESFFKLELPFAVALAPGQPTSLETFRAARAQQREVVLHLPLEPLHYPQVNPGPGTLLVTMSPLKITGTLKRYLDEAGPVTAVANHMGSLATQDMTVMTAVYQELKRRHVPFLHVAPAPGAVCKSLAADQGVAYAEPDVVLDAEPRASKPKALDAKWTQILTRAREHGPLLVMLRATPTTRAWLPGALSTKRLAGVSMVPVSAIVHPAPAL